jgi:hypothetical protein
MGQKLIQVAVCVNGHRLVAQIARRDWPRMDDWRQHHAHGTMRHAICGRR